MYPSLSDIFSGMMRLWLTAGPFDYLKLSLLVIVTGWLVSRFQR